MKRYLLDTDICIAFLQGKYRLNEKIKRIDAENCYISEITVAELLYGAYFSKRPEKHLAEVQKIKEIFQPTPVFNSLELFGQEKARLRREGSLIPDFDLLIGTSAVHFEMVMVSNNEKHLRRISGIELENWIKEGAGSD